MGDAPFILWGPYLRHLADQIRSHGGDVGGWMARSGLDAGDLDDASPALSLDRFRELVLDAVVAAREPALGLFLGHQLPPALHGALGYAALSCGSVRQGLELVERFVPLRLSVVAITTELRSGWLCVQVRESPALGEARRPVVEAVVATIKKGVDAISMGGCRIDAVDFAFPDPGYAALARELLGCTVRYARRASGFRLSPEALATPLRMADPVAFRDAAALLERELERTASPSLADRVRRLLFAQQNGFSSLNVVARALHTSPRTLHRRLLDEGTSFREVLEGVRRSLAIEHLKAGRLSIDEIAFSLGYSDLANFRRAFRRWESVSPSEFRAAHARRAGG